MGLQGYVGSSEDKLRIRRQEKQREDQRKRFEELKNQVSAKVQTAGFRQFGSSNSELLEAAFKNETVGLVTRDEYIKKRATIEQRLEEEAVKRKRDEEEATLRLREQRKRHKALQKKNKLSFADDEEDDDDEDEEAGGDTDNGVSNAPSASGNSSADDEPAAHKSGSLVQRKFAKFGKDPGVVTDFLPDKDREVAEEQLRDQLKKEWQAQQQQIKNEPLNVTYSYWDGQGHRRVITVHKGDSIGAFLKAVQKQLAQEFREMRHVSVDNLLYVKEDLIIPHNYTFYELILNKARGKSGPLFHFDVRDDIRVINDASKEKEDSHAGKVVERHWYERNKHIFPANRWEVFDADKNYDKYTIYGAGDD